jgi:hypothetical protein
MLFPPGTSSNGDERMNDKPNKKKRASDEKQMHQPMTSEEERIEAKIDRDLADSFPASDPPGWTLGVQKRRPKKGKS